MKRIPILLIVLFTFACKENKSETGLTNVYNAKEISKTIKKDFLIITTNYHFVYFHEILSFGSGDVAGS